MNYYIRKVTPSKWKSPLPEDGDHLKMGTDGITNCCRTQSNELSIWKTNDNSPCSEGNKKLLAAIAVAAERPAAIDFIFISDDEFTENGLSLKETAGNTIIESMRYLHRDIENLDVDKIGKLGFLISEKVNDDQEIHKVSQSKIKQYIRDNFPYGSEYSENISNREGWSKLYI